jgi:predicted nucleotidyltransferase component of viral defense system
VLSPEDRASMAERFGADDHQIARDHLISHLIAGLAASQEGVVLFGGTALSRTHLPDGRLSEDIDLYTVEERRHVAARLTIALPRSVRREYPRLTWRPGLLDVRDVEPALLMSPDGLVVRVQLLQADATYRRWPTELRRMDPRYSDVPTVSLTVPTASAFVAMKAAAWRGRHTARDLFDLAAMAARGFVDAESVALLRTVTGTALVVEELEHLPRDLYWRAQLAHQCRLSIDPETALRTIRTAWIRAAG